MSHTKNYSLVDDQHTFDLAVLAADNGLPAGTSWFYYTPARAELLGAPVGVKSWACRLSGKWEALPVALLPEYHDYLLAFAI